MLDLLRKTIMGKTIDTQMTMLLDAEIAAKKISKKLPTSSFLMVPISTILKPMTDTATDEQPKASEVSS